MTMAVPELETTLLLPKSMSLLEELSERMTSTTEALRKWMSSLLSHGVHWVLSCIEPCSQLGVAEDLISLIEVSHLLFGTALVRVGFLRCLATVENRDQ